MCIWVCVVCVYVWVRVYESVWQRDEWGEGLILESVDSTNGIIGPDRKRDSNACSPLYFSYDNDFCMVGLEKPWMVSVFESK